MCGMHMSESHDSKFSVRSAVAQAADKKGWYHEGFKPLVPFPG